MKVDKEKFISRAEWFRSYKFKKKLATVIAILLAITVVALFIIASLYKSYGSFTIGIDREEFTKYKISLRENEIDNPRSLLHAEPVKSMDNVSTREFIDYLSVKDIDPVTGGGSHNGNDGKYFAYTFFCCNDGIDPFSYMYTLDIKSKSNHIDKAIRVKLFLDGVDQGVWALQEDDGQIPLIDYDTALIKDDKGNPVLDENGKKQYNREQIFTDGIRVGQKNEVNHVFSGRRVASGKFLNLRPGQFTRITIIMWLEGSDPECLDDIRGGTIRMDMKMSILQEQPSETK